MPRIAAQVKDIEQLVDEVRAFLRVPTPEAWVRHASARDSLNDLLVDHANCEYKAAATGMALLSRYRHLPTVQQLMARLVREEMLHYEQVLALMSRFDYPLYHLSASRYAASLHQLIRQDVTGRLVDTLVVGALVEARSCERFAALYPHLPEPLSRFYRGLLRSEGRHYRDYLTLAYEQASHAEIQERLEIFLIKDAQLITSPDPQFRFHSGLPTCQVAVA